MQPEQTFNIGYASQQTGVASVTLRAWERCYGLIKPKRTAKGHRLYKQANINEIRQIILWLNRGVTISKVARLLDSNIVNNPMRDKNNHWLNLQQDILSELIKLKPHSLNQLIDMLNRSTPFIDLCEYVYQPLQRMLSERWQVQGRSAELELQQWQQCWQRQITLLTLRTVKQQSHAHCTLVNLGGELPSLHYWLFHGLLLQSGVKIDAINNLNDIASLNRLNHITVLPIILFAERRLESIEINPLSKLLSSGRGKAFCAGWMANIHSEQLAELAIEFKGGSASDCWQSAEFKAWLLSIGKQ
jgi:DNA-binding transcriptional MerR regulator